MLASLWSQWLWPILQVLIGFGLVIFVHELGHFLLAKRVGIKVERFALGFGPRLLGVRIGETDYCVNALPLGGYVKMLGQEDFKPLEDTAKPDPRSYAAKSVGARVAVVSAGVAMNVVFAAVLFVVVGIAGIRFPAPRVGGVQAGFPAATAEITWLESQPIKDAPAAPPTQPGDVQDARDIDQPPAKGLEGGDLILQLDGKQISRFTQLQVAGALAKEDKYFDVKIARDYKGRRWVGKTTMQVAKLPVEGARLGFGIVPAESTTIAEPADAKVAGPFEPGDVVVAVAGERIDHSWQIDDLPKDVIAASQVRVTVSRNGKELTVPVQPLLFGGDRGDVVFTDGQAFYGQVTEKTSTHYTMQMEDGSTRMFDRLQSELGSAELLDILGMSPRLRVLFVQDGSPADRASLKPGDIIVDYGDRRYPSMRQFLQISDRLAGEGTHVTVMRDGELLAPKWIVPTRRQGRALVGLGQSPDVAHAAVAAVRSGSPAARAGIEPGDEIERINDVAVSTWIDIYNALSKLAGEEIIISFRRGSQVRQAPLGALTAEMFDPEEYEFNLFSQGFGVLLGPLIKNTNPLSAIAWGTNETGEFILTTYATLRRLMGGTVSTKELRGPVGIGTLAFQVGRQSFVHFIYFMAMISVSLAVVNFLPIPVVDGGHVMFLAIEKIRGKPVPVRILNIAQTIGVLLLIALFVVLTWNDIARLLRGLW